MAETGVLIIYTRKPVAGHTKTRLIPFLGAEGAMRLHRKLLLHTMHTARESAFEQIEIHVSPDTGHPWLRQLYANFKATPRSQTGADLGERMYHSFATSLEEHDFAVIVGSDCPLLDKTVLDEAHDILQRGRAEVVLGPSQDGGYYLLGLRIANRALFQEIQWGSSLVAGKTREILQQQGLSWLETATLWDIDVPEDLGKLAAVPGYDDYRQAGADAQIAD